MKRVKKRKKVKTEDAPANNIGSGNIDLPNNKMLFGKKDIKQMDKDHEEGLRRFSSFMK